MKHINPLRSLRLLIAVSAISPYVSMPLGLIVPAGIVASISCDASYAIAQSPNLPTLPPAQPNPTDVGTAALPADANASSKSLLIKARAAFSEGKQDAAALAFAQATLAAQQSPDMAAELKQTRQQFIDRGMGQQVLDRAILSAQSSSSLNSRAANALRSKSASLPTGNSAESSVMLPPGLLSANSNNASGNQGGSSTQSAMLPPTLAQQSNTQAAGPANPLRDQAVGLTVEAKMALDRGDVSGAKKLIDRANSLRVPDSEFAPGQMRPWNVALDIDRAERLRGNADVRTASAVVPNGGVQNAAAQSVPAASEQNNVQSGIYQPKTDLSKVAPASGVLSSYDQDESGQELYKRGLAALSAGNKETALILFSSAWKKKADLDPGTFAQLKDKLTLLQSGSRANAEPESIDAVSPEGRESQMKRQKWFAEVSGEIADAEKMMTANKPMEALDRLRTLRLRVSQSDLDGTQRKNLLAMVDRVSNHMQTWVDENKSTIELDQRNQQIEDSIAMDASNRVKSDLQVQTLVDQYNVLIDAARYSEAEAVAKKVSEIAPNSEIASVLYNKAKIQRRVEEHLDIRSQKEEGFIDNMNGVDLAAIPYNDINPMTMPSLRSWTEMSKRRATTTDLKMSPRERKIREGLGEQFSATFDRRPLSDAMNTIAEMTGIPIIIDDRSIAEEGITVDQPITLDLKGNSISLKSALNVMLERLNLTYSIKNDVLNIESARFNKKATIVQIYNVKDLVIPIPNFVSDYNTGMAGALQSAYQSQTHMASATIKEDNVASVASRIANVDTNSAVLAQMNSMGGSMGGMYPGSMAGPAPGMFPSSTVGLGGGAQPNYFELINLIQNTVNPDQWQAVGGGSSTMQPFAQNLSLVVTAPQETHEAIADLLKSLRSLQNIQVTIEVRFIQLEDTFYERIGVDFDMNINDKVNRLRPESGGPSVAFGLAGATGPAGPVYTNDLDFHINNTFNVLPPAGRPDAGAGTTVGLAILSDLELFFFLEAAQGNSRSNVLQAPKVTMFDGQTASINDFAQRPFVISYDPVVGDFAVAQRPVIVVLNEGTQMNVQSVVSNDKRFVRLTLVPQFTRLEAADRQFTFQGKKTSNTGTSVLNNGVTTALRNNEDTLIEGTTVQQPTVGTTSVTTTVSVPDGGTILLGGIKRLREARTERGTPILSKIPYLNRLFKNSAIGRETNTLMMTVTPRIIIPEEEEELLGVTTNSRP